MFRFWFWSEIVKLHNFHPSGESIPKRCDRCSASNQKNMLKQIYMMSEASVFFWGNTLVFRKLYESRRNFQSAARLLLILNAEFIEVRYKSSRQSLAPG